MADGSFGWIWCRTHLISWSTAPLTVVVDSFSFHRVHVRIVRMLDPKDAVNAVSAADATLGAVQRIWSTIAAIAVLRI